MVKPFRAAQIEARLRVLVRRRSGPADRGAVTVGGLVVDEARRVAALDGRVLELSRIEFDLLANLARRSPEVVARRELLAEVWNQPYGGSDKTLDVHLSWLRRKLGETASEPRYLHTVRAVGVKLEAPDLP